MIERRARNWIDGEWVGSSETQSFNPATGETFGSFSNATAADAQDGDRRRRYRVP